MKTSDTTKTKKTTAKKTATKSSAKKTVAKAPVKKENPVKVTPAVVKANETKCASCPNCASCQDEMTTAFIQEVTEEVKNDNLKAFWNKYGLYIILFVVLSVSSAVGFETIRAWHQKNLQAKTEAYISAMIQSGNYENSIKSLEKISAGNYGIYSEFARIQIADILFEQNKKDDALNMLQSIVDNDKLSKNVRNLALFKLASYKIDTATSAEIREMLQPLVQEDNSWKPLAQEMLAMAAIKDGDFAGAREIYVNIMENSNLSENFKNRIQDMLSALSDM